MIFTAGRCVVGVNGTAYETLEDQLERKTVISAVNVIVNIIFVLFIWILMMYLSIEYRMYIYCSLCVKDKYLIEAEIGSIPIVNMSIIQLMRLEHNKKRRLFYQMLPQSPARETGAGVAQD